MESINEEEHRVEEFEEKQSQNSKFGKKLQMAKNLSEKIVKMPRPRNAANRDSFVLKSVGNAQQMRNPDGSFQQPQVLSTRKISTRMVSTKKMSQDQDFSPQETDPKIKTME